jgi:uncharacterized protein DUF4303
MDKEFFAALYGAAIAGIKETFERVVRKHVDERVCGFCIYSDSDAQSLCTTSATREALGHPKNFFCTSGWPYDWDEIKGLDAAQEEQSKSCTEFHNRYGTLWDNTDRDKYWERWHQYKDGVFETLVSAMQEVVRIGGFGEETARDQIFLCFETTDPGWEENLFPEWARRLNTPKMFSEYQLDQQSTIIRNWEAWLRK